ncbi:MAG: hypothetical protein LUH03_04950 [Oscillospiraceae bacterium]|nr:hypothetical protein [Oscillospiraceae bacterium]
MLNALYVLVSDEKDTYLEQTILSIESLKKASSGVGGVIVLVDQSTMDTLTGRRARICRVADKIIKVDVPDELDNRNRSRFLKTSMYQYVDNDFVFIDGDTIVCGDVEQAKGDYDVAAVLDLHKQLSEYPPSAGMLRRAKKCGFHVAYDDKHFNSGFMYVRKSEKSKEFFEQWHALWKETLAYGKTFDQTSLNEVNFRMGGVIHELDGIFNCQIRRYGTGLQFVNRAIVIHYFASNKAGEVPYDLSDVDLLRHALDDEYPANLQGILDNPKAAFRCARYVIADPVTAELLESRTFSCVNFLRRKCHILYAFVEKCLGFIAGISRHFRSN